MIWRELERELNEHFTFGLLNDMDEKKIRARMHEIININLNEFDLDLYKTRTRNE